MALSSAQKAQIRLYLGYPSFFRYLHYRLEGSFDAIDNDPDVQVLIAQSLASVAIVEAKIQSVAILVAGLKRIDDIEFYKNAQLIEIRKLGRMYVTRLSILTGVPIYSDVFGEQGYLGDKYSAGGLANSRASNIIPLG